MLEADDKRQERAATANLKRDQLGLPSSVQKNYQRKDTNKGGVLVKLNTVHKSKYLKKEKKRYKI